MPPIYLVREFLTYSRSSGRFTWLKSPTNKIPAGTAAGTVMNKGYLHVQLKGVLYLAHRLAWFVCTGLDPGDAQVDHRNGNRADNRFRNLRVAFRREADQAQNTCLRRDSTSGVKGVSWCPRRQKWRAYVSVGGNQVHLGNYESRSGAELARVVGKAKHHKFQPSDRRA